MNFEQFMDKCKELKDNDEIIILGEEDDPINTLKVEYPYTLKIAGIAVSRKHISISDYNKNYMWFIDIENFHLIQFPNNRKDRIHQFFS